MNRRGFLQLLGAAGAMVATGLTLEELLAPEKTIFLPSVAPQIVELTGIDVYSGNSLFVPQLWAAEAARILKRSLILDCEYSAKMNRMYGGRAMPPRNFGSYAKFDQIANNYV